MEDCMLNEPAPYHDWRDDAVDEPDWVVCFICGAFALDDVCDSCVQIAGVA